MAAAGSHLVVRAESDTVVVVVAAAVAGCRVAAGADYIAAGNSDIAVVVENSHDQQVDQV